MHSVGSSPTQGDVSDLLEHWDRYRAVTLQYLDLFSDEDLAWRPRADAFSSGQQLVHILQTEEFYAHALFDNDWDLARLRFPSVLPGRVELRDQFASVRARTSQRLAGLTTERLDTRIRHAYAPMEFSFRWWLWFVLEHEMHHKGHLAEYARQMGRVPPFLAFALPMGTRPDIQARIDLGGV